MKVESRKPVANKKRLERKHHILTIAHNLFETLGFNSVGIDRVIDESRSAKASFYSLFGSRKILLSECIQYEIEKEKEEIIAILDQYNTSNREKISNIYMYYLNERKINPHGNLITKASIELWNDSEVIKLIDQHKSWIYQNIYILLTELKCKPENVKIVFNLLESTLHARVLNVLSLQEFDRFVDLIRERI